jgi:hypothetical protein
MGKESSKMFEEYEQKNQKPQNELLQNIILPIKTWSCNKYYVR